MTGLRDTKRAKEFEVVTGSKMYHFNGMPSRVVAAPEVEIKRSFADAIQKRMTQDNLSISVVAERMGTGRTAVRRILDVKNTSITFRSMSRIARAVGLELKLTAEPMSPDDLGRLAHRLAKSKNRAESAKLADQITKGFYAES